MAGEDYLHLIKINTENINHITLKNPKRCKTCQPRNCVVVCPSDVFVWDEGEEKLDVLWRRCVECGACEIACPQNVEFSFPRGGYGVNYIL